MELTDDTFLLFASQHYLNPNCCSMEEFVEDINRIKYLKKLFYAFKNKGTLRERLILNHLVILYNVFDVKACTEMLFHRLEGHYDCLAAFLIYLGYMPEKVTVNDKILLMSDIKINAVVVAALREFDKERKK